MSSLKSLYRKKKRKKGDGFCIELGAVRVMQPGEEKFLLENKSLAQCGSLILSPSRRFPVREEGPSPL